MGARKRIVTLVCALAVLAVPLLGPAAVAQTEPVFPEGVWRATNILFDSDVMSEGGRVQYDGYGSLTLEGTADGETINVSGEVHFEALSKAESPLGTSERVYQGVWRVEGWGSKLDAFGIVSVKARETPVGAVAPITTAFDLDGHGVLTLKFVGCLGLRATFVTEEIPLPGATTGPALIGSFLAFPDLLSRETDVMFEELTELTQDLAKWMRTPDLSDPSAVAAVLDRLGELARLLIEVQQASADKGVCGPLGRFHRGGVPFQSITDLVGDLAFIVGFANTTTPNQLSAETLIEVYKFAAQMGAFHSPDTQDIKTMNIYPLELEKLLADAIVDNQWETIDRIRIAAEQYGWQSLAEKADVPR